MREQENDGSVHKFLAWNSLRMRSFFIHQSKLENNIEVGFREIILEMGGSESYCLQVFYKFGFWAQYLMYGFERGKKYVGWLSITGREKLCIMILITELADRCAETVPLYSRKRLTNISHSCAWLQGMTWCAVKFSRRLYGAAAGSY
jgi:hypothetical protein